jgi:hypothetical protein
MEPKENINHVKVKKTPDFAQYAREMGTDVNGEMLISYNAAMHEFYCEFCRKNFPGSLPPFYMS